MKQRFIALLFLLAAAAALYQPIRAQAPPASNAQYAYIATIATTTVKASPAFLHTVTINTGAAGTVTLYDIAGVGCTGTPASGKFATIQAVATTNDPVSLVYDVQTKNGLCVVTAAATDVTVSFN